MTFEIQYGKDVFPRCKALCGNGLMMIAYLRKAEISKSLSMHLNQS